MGIEELVAKLGVLSSTLLFIFVMSLVCYIIYKIGVVATQNKLKPIAKELNAEIKSSCFAGTYISILNYGTEIRFRCPSQYDQSRPYLLLELLNPVRLRFKILKKQALNQMLFRWGEEVKLNDISFDEEYLIRSDKPSEASAYLMNSKRMDAIKCFFENDFDFIEANEEGIRVKKRNYTDEDLEPEQVRTYLENLNSFNIL